MKLRLKVVTGIFASLCLLNLGLAKTAHITADDTMRFSQTEINVPVGEELTITLENIGSMPKQAMGHNLVILKPGSDISTFSNAAATEPLHDYIPTEGEAAKELLAHTKLLGPSESDSLTITFAKPGTYPYLCSFPGHWVQMKGLIIVK